MLDPQKEESAASIALLGEAHLEGSVIMVFIRRHLREAEGKAVPRVTPCVTIRVTPC